MVRRIRGVKASRTADRSATAAARVGGRRPGFHGIYYSKIMIAELTLVVGLQADIKSDAKQDLQRACRSRFKLEEEQEREREERYERLFRLLLREVQKNG